MPFRSDTEALRSRVEVLQADLKRAEAELASSKKEAAEAHHLRMALLRIEAQLAEVRGERINPRAQRTAAAGLAGGLALVVAGAMFARSTVSHMPVGAGTRTVATHIQPVILPVATQSTGPSWFAPRLLTANVDDVIGHTPVVRNARCDVLVAAAEIDSLDCRVTITCGSRIVYGGENQGYLPCQVHNGEPTSGEDLAGVQEDGDPMLEMDLTTGRIVVANDEPSMWRLDLTVFEAPAQPPGFGRLHKVE